MEEPSIEYKGPSPIVVLKALDVVWGVPPDYMHCTLLGVAKHLAELWMLSPGEAYYLGRKMNIINRRLCGIRPPTSFTRLIRAFSEYSFWKASEWKAWVLYFMMPTLNNIQPVTFFVHALLLTRGLFLLLKRVATEGDVSMAEQLFRRFVHDTARLYGESAVRFNVHQLLHLGNSVRKLGSLWATSMFPFEGGNGKVLDLVPAVKGVPLQIAEGLVMDDTLHEMLTVIPLSHQLKGYAQRLLKVNEKTVGCHGLGAAICHRQLSGVAAELLCDKVGGPVMVEQYLRVVVNGVIHSSEYTRTQRTCSSYVKMRDGSSCEVREIFLFREESDRITLLCKRLHITFEDLGHASHIHKCHHPPASEGLCMHLDDDVESQIIFINFEVDQNICDHPNTWETGGGNDL